MRATDVRDALKSAVENIAPDTKTHAGDVFRITDPGFDVIPMDRQAILERARPQEPANKLLVSADPYMISFELIVSYTNTPGVASRMLKDGDKILDALLDVPVTNAQILTIDISGGADLIDEQGQRAASYTIDLEYDRRDT